MRVEWRRKGLIYSPQGKHSWDDNSFLTPTPFLLDESTIRIYGGLRDKEGRSRISYIDVSAAEPSRILKVAERPVIELGRDGMFDDNGMILGDVIRDGDVIRLYYVGFQLPQKAKFLAFSGLAISRDGGETFVREGEAPIMERSEEAPFIRAIHGVLREGDIWRLYYSAGSGWEIIDGAPFPQYEIRTMESRDGLQFSSDGQLCLTPKTEEYRIGRSRVRKLDNGLYEMYFVYSTKDKHFGTGYALSSDGWSWQRRDDLLNLGPPQGKWESDMCGYAAPLVTKDKTYIFYSGNGMGRSGVGYAEAVYDAN